MLETALSQLAQQGLLGALVLIVGFGYVKKDKELQAEKGEHKKTIEACHARELQFIKDQNEAMDHNIDVLEKVAGLLETAKFQK